MAWKPFGILQTTKPRDVIQSWSAFYHSIIMSIDFLRVLTSLHKLGVFWLIRKTVVCFPKLNMISFEVKMVFGCMGFISIEVNRRHNCIVGSCRYEVPSLSEIFKRKQVVKRFKITQINRFYISWLDMWKRGDMLRYRLIIVDNIIDLMNH